MIDISAINEFLLCSTPEKWIEDALKQPGVLLIDHANCEKKAASTALNLIFRYSTQHTLLNKMSRLAREELRHFEQVIAIMHKRGIEYRTLSASRYASGLHKHCSKDEPQKLVDQLIVGAIIEARSCERFAAIAPHLDEELQSFYLSLLKSESRHFKDYLKLSESIADKPIDNRVKQLLEIERDLITSHDTETRFHSGPLATSETE